MYSLNKSQVDIIIADVGLAKISLSHLADDLIDHICCEVEKMMQDGKSFESSYKHIKKEAGIEVLRDIQDKTKYLIDKNYRLMKTSMKITGNISLALLGFATVFKIMHWPGAGIGFVLGFALLTAVFFPLAVFTNYRYNGKKQNLFLHITVLLGGIFFMIGVLFKVMHWPGAGIDLMAGYTILLLIYLPALLIVNFRNAQAKNDKVIYFIGVISFIIYGFSNMFKMLHWPGAAIMMLFGALLLISVFLPMYTWRRIQLEGKITGQFVFIITLSMFVILLNSLIVLNVSKNVLGGFVNQADDLIVLSEYQSKRNIELLSQIDLQKDTLDLKVKAEKIKKESEELIRYIENIQIDLLSKVQQMDKEEVISLLENPENIVQKDNIDAVWKYMIGEEGQGEAKNLKEKLNTYKSEMKNYVSNNNEYNLLVTNTLDMSDKVMQEENLTWEELNFSKVPVIRAITKLKEIQLNVMIAESEAFEILLEQNSNL